MISHKHKTIFIHIPKTAGQSIELAFLEDLQLRWETRSPLLLRPNDNPLIGPPRLAHLKYHEYTKFHYLSQELLDNYFTFSFVRNPYSRAISFYKYISKKDKSFNDFICSDLPRLHQEKNYFFESQSRFICDANGTPRIDFVGRFESIKFDFQAVAKRARLQSSNLPKRNISKDKNEKFKISQDLMKNYNYDSLEIINSIYDEDFRNFYPKERITP